jgi:hypothetical protein
VPPLEVVQIVLDDCRGEFFLAKLIWCSFLFFGLRPHWIKKKTKTKTKILTKYLVLKKYIRAHYSALWSILNILLIKGVKINLTNIYKLIFYI